MKDSKIKAGYRPYPNDVERCGKCSMFIPTDNTCTAVQGKVTPHAWCDYFKLARGPFGVSKEKEKA